MSLAEEQLENVSTACKIIGITLETRPDCINPQEIALFRKFALFLLLLFHSNSRRSIAYSGFVSRYGCTRIQLGIQHTADKILELINRGCTTDDAINAIRLLKLQD